MSNSAKPDKPAKTQPRVARAPVALADCGMARAIDMVGDRWVLLVLRELFYGVRRFDDLEADTGAPRAVLSQRLRSLVSNGLADRIPYKEEGSRTRYEYVLTPKGRDLGVVVAALTEWGDRHLRNDPAPVEFIDAAGGAALHLAFVAKSGKIVPNARVGVRVKAKTKKP